MINLNHIREFARQAHKGQKYGDKDYFEYHVLGVAQYARREAIVYGLNRDMAEAVALLHDVFEDTDAKWSQMAFSPLELAEAVRQLTHNKEEKSYYAYIKGIRNPFALIVKAADLAFNIENSGPNHKKLSLYQFAVEDIGRRLGDWWE